MNQPRTRAEARAALTLYILTPDFWMYALERIIKTFAQAFLSAAFAGGVAVGIHEIDWLLSLSIAAGAALLSFITAVIQYSRPSPEANEESE